MQQKLEQYYTRMITKSSSKSSIETEGDCGRTLVDTPQKWRTDWSEAVNMKTMTDAVAQWDALQGTKDAPSSKAKFAESKSIPPFTFYKYSHNDLSKRRKIGSQLGRRNKSTDPPFERRKRERS